VLAPSNQHSHSTRALRTWQETVPRVVLSLLSDTRSALQCAVVTARNAAKRPKDPHVARDTVETLAGHLGAALESVAERLSRPRQRRREARFAQLRQEMLRPPSAEPPGRPDPAPDDGTR
jgi:hypothetical protein